MLTTSQFGLDDLIRLAIKRAESKGAISVRSNLAGEIRRPDRIGNFLPDAVANGGAGDIIIFAATAERIMLGHAKQAIEGFLRYTLSANACLVLVAASWDVDDVEGLLRDLCDPDLNNVDIWPF